MFDKSDDCLRRLIKWNLEIPIVDVTLVELGDPSA